ncbi:MAG: hypothetical protein JW784_04895 [Candidatus Cloacimonetes bacterium]|nr:hypothetical protein [Candidatus Cloacimonadota bacterium]
MKVKLFFYIFILFAGCTQKITPGLEDFNWLLGTWLTNNDTFSFEESWQIINDSTYLGHGVMIEAGDTVFSEKLALKVIEGEIFYLALDPEQNKSEEISFRLTESKHHHLVFSNPEHDFPTSIEYKLVNDTTLFIKLSGRNNRGTTLILRKILPWETGGNL